MAAGSGNKRGRRWLGNFGAIVTPFLIVLGLSGLRRGGSAGGDDRYGVRSALASLGLPTLNPVCGSGRSRRRVGLIW